MGFNNLSFYVVSQRKGEEIVEEMKRIENWKNERK